MESVTSLENLEEYNSISNNSVSNNSVSSAVLFYSRHNMKSMKYKNIIESLNIDMYMVCVDSADVKDKLLNDNKYQIKFVPTVLTIYESGNFMIYTGNDLDNWFNQLIENVRNYNNEAQHVQEIVPLAPQSSFIDNTPLQAENESFISSPGEVPPNLELSNIPETHRVKEVKKPDVNPSELAAEMMKQRELHDENLEKNKPFM